MILNSWTYKAASIGFKNNGGETSLTSSESSLDDSNELLGIESICNYFNIPLTCFHEIFPNDTVSEKQLILLKNSTL